MGICKYLYSAEKSQRSFEKNVMLVEGSPLFSNTHGGFFV
jgi:hypothetical protein